MQPNKQLIRNCFPSVHALTVVLSLTLNLYLQPTMQAAQPPPFRWIEQAGGDTNDFCRGIAVDGVGNSYVTGSFHDVATFGSTNISGSGVYDIFVAKYDNAGNILWVRQAGESGFDDYGLGIAVDSAGNCYVTGGFSGVATFGTNTLNNSGGSDMFIAKYDTDGNLLWAKQSTGLSGNLRLNAGRGIAVDAAGNSYVTGLYQGNVTLGSTNLTSSAFVDYDMFVAKYDGSGELVWATSGGGGLDDVGYGIAADAAGNSFVVGYFGSPTANFGSFTLINSSSTNSPDIFIVKYDSAGNVLWAEQAGGSAFDSGYAIAVDTAGNSHVTGIFQGTATFSGTNVTSSGAAANFIAKYNSAGNLLWVKEAGGTTDDGGGITVDSEGNSYLTGWFAGTSTFGNTNLTSNGSNDLFVARYNSAGNLIWVKQAGGSDDDRGYGIAVDAERNVYAAGFFTGSASFDSETLNSHGGWDCFMARLDGPPRLNVARTGNQFVLSWPTNQVGFQLESVTNLSANNLWTAVTNSSVVIGDQNVVSNNISIGNKFYRLKNP